MGQSQPGGPGGNGIVPNQPHYSLSLPISSLVTLRGRAMPTAATDKQGSAKPPLPGCTRPVHCAVARRTRSAEQQTVHWTTRCRCVVAAEGGAGRARTYYRRGPTRTVALTP